MGRTRFPFEAKGQVSRKPKRLPGLDGPSAVKGTPPPLGWTMRVPAVYTFPSSRPQGPSQLSQVPCRVGSSTLSASVTGGAKCTHTVGSGLTRFPEMLLGDLQATP